MSSIAAVVVTYNRKELLETCIERILSQSDGTPDVLVIDNASADGTGDLVDNRFGNEARVKYFNTGNNLGGAGGFSYGINVAVNLGYEYLWIMDDDTFPETTALESLLKASDLLDGKFGFLSSYVKWTDGSACKMNIPKVSPNWRNCIDIQFDNRMLAIESASFVSLFVRSSIVNEVGLPIKEFFIWGDDVEYSKRISSRYTSFFVYDSQVVHAMKSNLSTSIVEEMDEQRIQRYGLLYRNKYFIIRNAPARVRIAYWLDIRNVIKDICKNSNGNKWRKCKLVIKSSIEGLFFNPSIEYVDSPQKRS